MAQHELSFAFPIMRHVVDEMDFINTELIGNEMDENEVDKHIRTLILYVQEKQTFHTGGKPIWLDLSWTDGDGRRLKFKFSAEVVDADEDEESEAADG